MKRQLVVALAALLLLAGFAAATWAWRTQQAETVANLAQDQSQVFAPADAMTLGNPDARVVLVEFFDPACEACAAFYQPLKQVLARHPDRVKLVMRYAAFHQGSDVAVKMLEAARQQGKYWQALEAMYATQPYWASHHHPQPELLWEILPQAGIDIDPLRAAVESGSFDAVLARDMADAQALGVRKTPSFFVNGKPLSTFGYDPLVALIEAELALQYPTP